MPRVLVCGDVAGQYRLLCKQGRLAHERMGPFDFFVCVGRFSASLDCPEVFAEDRPLGKDGGEVVGRVENAKNVEKNGENCVKNVEKDGENCDVEKHVEKNGENMLKEHSEEENQGDEEATPLILRPIEISEKIELDCMPPLEKKVVLPSDSPYLTEELKSLINGDIPLPIPTFFIDAGPRAAYLFDAAPHGGAIAPNLFFLGLAGVRCIQGLSVAYLSGQYNPAYDTLFQQSLGKEIQFLGGNIPAVLAYRQLTQCTMGGVASCAETTNPHHTVQNSAENSGENSGKNIAENSGENSGKNIAENSGKNIAENSGENIAENSGETRGKKKCEKVLGDMMYEFNTVMTLMGAAPWEAGVSLDLLLTCEWPAFVDASQTTKTRQILMDTLIGGGLEGAQQNGELSFESKPHPNYLQDLSFLTMQAHTFGSPCAAMLAERLEPRYHLCAGLATFYQRPPYKTCTRGYESRLVCLGSLGCSGKKGKPMHALNLTSVHSMDMTSLRDLGPDCTPSPFSSFRHPSSDLPTLPRVTQLVGVKGGGSLERGGGYLQGENVEGGNMQGENFQRENFQGKNLQDGNMEAGNFQVGNTEGGNFQRENFQDGNMREGENCRYGKFDAEDRQPSKKSKHSHPYEANNYLESNKGARHRDPYLEDTKDSFQDCSQFDNSQRSNPQSHQVNGTRDPISAQANTANKTENKSKTVFVSNLPYEVSEKSLVKVFASFGNISSIQLPKDEGSHRCLGKAWITYESEEGAEGAVASNEALESGNRRLRISYHLGPPPRKYQPNLPPRKYQPNLPPPGTIVDVHAHQGCWFCLANPDVENHLIVSIGTNVYVTMAKGGLNNQHVLIVPVTHLPNAFFCPSVVTAEIALFVRALRLCFSAQGLETILFERYIPMRNTKGMHMQIQVIGIPRGAALKSEKLFLEEGMREGVTLVREADAESVLCPMEILRERVRSLTEAYFYLEVSEKPEEGFKDSNTHRYYIRRYVYVGKSDNHRDNNRQSPKLMNFGRQIIAKAIDKPEIADWKKAATINTNSELNLADQFRTSFLPFQPALGDD